LEPLATVEATKKASPPPPSTAPRRGREPLAARPDISLGLRSLVLRDRRPGTGHDQMAQDAQSRGNETGIALRWS